MNQTEALVQFISDLNSLSVPYMITGAYAVSYFGLPRATHDLDIVMAVSHSFCEEFEKILSSVKVFESYKKHTN
ncbi:MAG: hypothetical protein A3I09_01665 [Deltaproteobacteria bacterium RIFCSPLOWO2_02_FULL_47_10]|nr:MAG: hypothetical protein A3I09_01665 [Deltaproteobacteria bacterium RIFCSPLOWO2_02_FULL_47_10]